MLDCEGNGGETDRVLELDEEQLESSELQISTAASGAEVVRDTVGVEFEDDDLGKGVGPSSIMQGLTKLPACRAGVKLDTVGVGSEDDELGKHCGPSTNVQPASWAGVEVGEVVSLGKDDEDGNVSVLTLAVGIRG